MMSRRSAASPRRSAAGLSWLLVFPPDEDITLDDAAVVLGRDVARVDALLRQVSCTVDKDKRVFTVPALVQQAVVKRTSSGARKDALHAAVGSLAAVVDKQPACVAPRLVLRVAARAHAAAVDASSLLRVSLFSLPWLQIVVLRSFPDRPGVAVAAAELARECDADEAGIAVLARVVVQMCGYFDKDDAATVPWHLLLHLDDHAFPQLATLRAECRAAAADLPVLRDIMPRARRIASDPYLHMRLWDCRTPAHLSADGSRLMLKPADRSITVIDTVSGQVMAQHDAKDHLSAPEGSGYPSWGTTHSGRLDLAVCVGHPGWRIGVVSLASDAVVCVLPGHDDYPRILSMAETGDSADQLFLAFHSDSGGVSVRSVRNGSVVASLGNGEDFAVWSAAAVTQTVGGGGALYLAHLSHNEGLVISRADNGRFDRVGTVQCSPRNILAFHDAATGAGCFLVVRVHGIDIVDAASAEIVRTLVLEPEVSGAVLVRLPDQRVAMVAGSKYGAVSIFDIATGLLLLRVVGLDGFPYALAAAAGNGVLTIAASSSSKGLMTWRVPLSRLNPSQSPAPAPAPAPARVTALTLARDADGDAVVVTGHACGSVVVWHRDTGELRRHLSGHDDDVFGADTIAHSDGRVLIVTASFQDGFVHVHDLHASVLLYQLQGDCNSALVAFRHPVTRRAIAVVGTNETIDFWDLEQGLQLHSLDCCIGTLALAIVPSSQQGGCVQPGVFPRAILFSGEEWLDMLDPVNPVLPSVGDDRYTTFNTLHIAVDGVTAISGTNRGMLDVWQVNGDCHQRTILGNEDILDVEVSALSSYMASHGTRRLRAVTGSIVGWMCVWDVLADASLPNDALQISTQRMPGSIGAMQRDDVDNVLVAALDGAFVVFDLPLV